MMKDWNKLTAIQKILRVRGEGLKIEVYDQAEKEFAELEQITAEREAMRLAVLAVMQHYDDVDDEFSESFYCDNQYRILNIDPDTEEWHALLTLKQIAKRRMELALKGGQGMKLFQRIWEFIHLWGTYHYDERIGAALAWELAGIFVDHPIEWDGMIIIKKDVEP